MRELLAALGLTLPFVLGATESPRTVGGEVVLTFADPQIVESSGLVVLPDDEGDLFVTVNDSGDGARVFAVDPRDGETVGVTTWDAEPRDIEALAPGEPGHVWVGDIGDNLRSRESVVVTQVPVGREEASVPGESYELVYPDGPRDAETLLRHPVTGQLLVVSKDVFGGTVYAAPRRLDPERPNELTALGRTVGIVTDGAFGPLGDRLLLRTYGRLFLLSYPELEQLAQADLPEQPQGEGVALSTTTEAYVSTEGQFSEVLRVPVPASGSEARVVLGQDPWPWVLAAVVAAGSIGLGWFGVARLRRV